MKPSFLTRASGVLIILAATSFPCLADEALARLERYIATDTSNPPGNESRGVAFFAEIFDTAGIAYETVEPEPGRGSIWAKLEGGDEPGLVLLHHIDVVPASPDAWQTDPLTPVIKDGFLHGRGALDIKSLGIAHLQAFLALHKTKGRSNRDVIFMATADEEAGGLVGAGWLVEHRRDILDGVGYLLNEGGGLIVTPEHGRMQIEAAQKRPYWLRLTASGQPGHGSSPRTTSATTKLIAALNNIANTPFEPHVTPAVREMFRALSPYVEAQWQPVLADIDTAMTQPGFLDKLHAEKHRWHALLRNTCSITMLDGSSKINVVPAQASAELDCRILPDQDAPGFLIALEARIDDPDVEVEEIMLFDPAASSTDTDLFRLLVAESHRYYPDAGVMPSVSRGFTDSHFFREIGIVSYGFGPFIVPEKHLGSVHGNNERIGVEHFQRGVELMHDVVFAFTTPIPH